MKTSQFHKNLQTSDLTPLLVSGKMTLTRFQNVNIDPLYREDMLNFAKEYQI